MSTVLGIAVPPQLKKLVAGDLPYEVASAYRPHVACQGFYAEDDGTVEVTMALDGEDAQTHVLPVSGRKNEWLGDVKSVEAFVGTTTIWLYLTPIFD